MKNKIILNGECLDASSPYLSSNRAFRYGDGVFESIRIINGEPISFEHHYNRICAGLQALKIKHADHFTLDYITDQLKTLIKVNGIDQGGKARLTIFREGKGTYMPDNNHSEYLLEVEKLKCNYFELNKEGIIIGVFKEINKNVNRFSKFKTLNGLLYVLASEYAKENEIDDSLILNELGKIIETTSSNIFIVSNGVLYTPPLDDGCIGGIMRMQVINIAVSNNITVYESSLSPQNLLFADEIFLTNSINGLKWVGGFQQKRYFNDISKKMIRLINEQLISSEKDLKES